MGVQYLEPASPVDVMFDQIEHLMWHSEKCNRTDCVNCTRLEQVRRLLMVPFLKLEYVQAAGK